MALLSMLGLRMALPCRWESSDGAVGEHGGTPDDAGEREVIPDCAVVKHVQSPNGSVDHGGTPHDAGEGEDDGTPNAGRQYPYVANGQQHRRVLGACVGM